MNTGDHRMKIINSEGIVFGLLPKETQDEMKRAVENGAKCYAHQGGIWFVVGSDKNFYSSTAYKVEIHEPTTVIDWLEKIPCPRTRESAIEQCRKGAKYSHCDSLSQAINKFTTWDYTKEKHNFWEDCYDASQGLETWPEYPEKKTVPWERDDYKCAPFLRDKDSGSDYSVINYTDKYIYFITSSFTYEEVAESFTMPDGTPLYKEVDE